MTTISARHPIAIEKAASLLFMVSVIFYFLTAKFTALFLAWVAGGAIVWVFARQYFPESPNANSTRSTARQVGVFVLATVAATIISVPIIFGLNAIVFIFSEDAKWLPVIARLSEIGDLAALALGWYVFWIVIRPLPAEPSNRSARPG